MNTGVAVRQCQPDKVFWMNIPTIHANLGLDIELSYEETNVIKMLNQK